MRISVTRTFRRDYEKLPAHIREKTDRQLKVLARDLRHPSLQVKKVQGTGDIWEARVDLAYRLTFKVQEDILFLRRVGSHQVLQKP